MRTTTIVLASLLCIAVASAQMKWGDRSILLKVSPLSFHQDGTTDIPRTLLATVRNGAWFDNLSVMREAVAQPRLVERLRYDATTNRVIVYYLDVAEGNPVMGWGLRHQPADLLLGVLGMASMNYVLHWMYEFSPIAAWVCEVVATTVVVVYNIKDRAALDNYYRVRLALYSF